jgi:hypothetical protein
MRLRRSGPDQGQGRKLSCQTVPAQAHGLAASASLRFVATLARLFVGFRALPFLLALRPHLAARFNRAADFARTFLARFAHRRCRRRSTRRRGLTDLWHLRRGRLDANFARRHARGRFVTLDRAFLNARRRSFGPGLR